MDRQKRRYLSLVVKSQKKILKIFSDGIMSIGKAIPNSRLKLMKNEKFQKEGEILISGKQISPGYLNSSLETKKVRYHK